VVWWLIPLLATVAAWVYTRVAGAGAARVRPRPEPGSEADRRDLARLAEALSRPLPGRSDG
jgi:hypothetical protein